ncbi:hypothetical protein MBLNU459_g1751t1 [Dothideomycetes sp. NU459]
METGHVHTKSSIHESAKEPNIFDYIRAELKTEHHDDESTTTSEHASDNMSSPRDPYSERGSSSAPETPSSTSTLPSPHVLTHKRDRGAKYKKEETDSSDHWYEAGVNTHDPIRNYDSYRSRSEDEVPEAHTSNESSWINDHSYSNLQEQEQALRDHIARTHHVRPQVSVVTPELPRRAVGAHTAPSVSQQHFYPRPKAIQEGPSSPRSLPKQNYTGHQEAHAAKPVAPEAPELNRTTLAGYELMAAKLTEASPALRPLYRKFEHLGHRVLLHIQDEICELEEHLRVADECLTQLDCDSDGKNRRPASRRVESQYGTELHHRRTLLLGQIFVKLEQYHRALSAYAGVAKEFEQPSGDDIAKYRRWMSTTKPVHDAESRFLRHDHDLVVFPQRSVFPKTSNQPIVVFLPFILLMPLLAFAVTPGFLGRVFTTALIAAAIWMAISGSEIRPMMAPREWAVAITL